MPSEIRTTITDIFKYFTLAFLGVGLFVLIVTAILIQDSAYITNNPKRFIIELLIMSTVTAIPIAIISSLRGSAPVNTLIEYLIVFLKLAIFHILLQLSGIFSIQFENSGSSSRNICSDKVNKLIKNGALFGGGITMIILVLGSILVRDTYYIEKDSTKFIIETVLMGIFSIIPLIAIQYLRNDNILTFKTPITVLVGIIITGGIHILTQLSGSYTVFFPASGDPTLV